MLKSCISNIKIPKILLAVVVSSFLSSTKLYAHDSCHIELDAGLLLNETTIEFFNGAEGSEDNKKTLYKIENNHSLIVQGHEIDLNDQQQMLVTQYATSIRAIIPQIGTIATESIDLALKGASLVFNEILGESNNIESELTQELSMLRDEITTHFTEGDSITIDGSSGEILGKKFEQRIEAVIEKAVINSMGAILIAIGQELLFSQEDDNTIDNRMDDFSASIENEMKLRAKQIERKADALCLTVIDIDRLEEQLKKSIPVLKSINVLSATYNQ
jgi:hypothetical protein